jgi:hypothetical protein
MEPPVFRRSSYFADFELGPVEGSRDSEGMICEEACANKNQREPGSGDETKNNSGNDQENRETNSDDAPGKLAAAQVVIALIPLLKPSPGGCFA